MTTATRPAARAETVQLQPMNLDDKSQFWSRPGVPILDENVYQPPNRKDGTQPDPVVFDGTRLQRICEIGNRRATEGDYPVIRLGHCDHTLPESFQPKPIGFAKNFRLANWLNDNGNVLKPGRYIVVDLFFYSEITMELVASYPHRSIEMNFARDIIDGVSLLRRPPERSLGLLTYERADEGRTSNLPHSKPTPKPKVQTFSPSAEIAAKIEARGKVINRLESRVEKIEAAGLENRLSFRRMLLQEVAAKGLPLDIEDMLSRTKTLDKASFEGFVDVLSAVPKSKPVPRQNLPLNQAELRKAMTLMSEAKISSNEAIRRIRAESASASSQVRPS